MIGHNNGLCHPYMQQLLMTVITASIQHLSSLHLHGRQKNDHELMLIVTK